ncbi:MAG: DUF3971 domain-containing protein [Halioglobus sp.]
METSAFHKLSRVLWVFGVGVVVLLAIYVSLGRFAVGMVSAYQDDILSELNSRLPFQVEARSVSGDWRMFTPELVLSELRLSFPDSPERPLELREGRLSIDVLSTLKTRSLQSRALRLENLTLHAVVDESGAWDVAGFESDGSGRLNAWLEAFVANVTQIELVENSLIVGLPDHSERAFTLDLLLRREGSRRQLGATLKTSEGAVVKVLVDGVGDPFDRSKYDGDIYIHTQVNELARFESLMPVKMQSDIRVSGRAEFEAWIDWKDGSSSIDVQVDADSLDIRARDNSWRVPAQALSFGGSFVEQRNFWSVFASQVELSDGGSPLSVPRVQLDGWGDSLRVRAQQLDLAVVNQLLIDSGTMPQGLSSVLEILSPRGQLATIEYSIEDTSQLTAGWQFSASFEELAVESWKGAPGVTSANGFLELSPGSGSVILDSQLFELAFPTIYDEPLRYNELYGTIGIDWDQERLTLSSGKIVARGVEGEATALFGLLVPFTKVETGVEMELLVGLVDSNPIHRSKYLPRNLNPALLGWLKSSIGEGRIREGAFLWRGSLAKQAPQHRSIQLFFDVRDTHVTYHPDWPAIGGVAGLVLIDDAQVSFWSEKAQLYDSIVRQLSAETWLEPSGRMKLAINGNLTGSAADGLRVVNNSPLNDIVGSAFSAWSLEGDLETRLHLVLDLGADAQPPLIEVDVELEDVDLMARPGNLPVSQLSGNVNYSSLEGFSSQTLSGRLWGEAIAARLRQRDVELDGARYSASTSPVEILLEGNLAPASLQSWLGIDALAFMAGKAAMTGGLLVTPGEPVSLQLSSTLAGISLDMPEPWSKSAEEELGLELYLPLSGDISVLDVRADTLHLRADISGASLNSASVAVDAEPLPLEPGGLRITGNAPLVDVDGWMGFVQRYFVAPVEDEPTVTEEAPTKVGFWFGVEDLRATQLRFPSQIVSDVLISLQQGEAGWLVTAHSEWFDGQLQLQNDLKTASLLVRSLELSGLTTLEAIENELQEPLVLPTVDVTVEQLLSDGDPIGELTFVMATEGELLTAGPFVGQYAGMKMNVDNPSMLSWRQGGELEETRLVTAFEINDMGESLEQLGYPRLLETESGTLMADIVWPGGPEAFAIENLVGSVRLNAGRGRFVDPPEGTSGTLRMVSFLNLAGIVNRLSLSHMFESGIPFDSVQSEAFFHGGTAEVPAMIVQGASSGFQFSGVTDLVSQTIEGELVVTLPVANNLPWVAALAAGLPIAAGVFVVSKVFQKQVDRFSSGVYKVSGSLDKPDVSFDRIFDNTQINTISQVASDANSPSSKPANEDSSLTPQERAAGFSLPAASQKSTESSTQAPLTPDPNTATAQEDTPSQ